MDTPKKLLDTHLQKDFTPERVRQKVVQRLVSGLRSRMFVALSISPEEAIDLLNNHKNLRFSTNGTMNIFDYKPHFILDGNREYYVISGAIVEEIYFPHDLNKEDEELLVEMYTQLLPALSDVDPYTRY